MGPNEQNKHFTELRQKVGKYTQKLLLLKGLGGKHDFFVTKREKNSQPSLGQTYYSNLNSTNITSISLK